MDLSGNSDREISITSMSEEFKEELCLSDLYSLLQTSISTVDSNPHQSIDTLTLLMEQICSQQESLQQASPPPTRLEFWRQVNATWLFVIESALRSETLKRKDWEKVCETIIAAGNVLSLYGLIDYPMGFSEAKIIETIINGLTE